MVTSLKLLGGNNKVVAAQKISQELPESLGWEKYKRPQWDNSAPGFSGLIISNGMGGRSGISQTRSD